MGNRGKKKSKALPTGDERWDAGMLGTFVWDPATGSYAPPPSYHDPTGPGSDSEADRSGDVADAPARSASGRRGVTFREGADDVRRIPGRHGDERVQGAAEKGAKTGREGTEGLVERACGEVVGFRRAALGALADGGEVRRSVLDELSSHLDGLASIEESLSAGPQSASLATLCRHLLDDIPTIRSSIDRSLSALEVGTSVPKQQLLLLVCGIDRIAGALRYAAVALRSSHGWDGRKLAAPDFAALHAATSPHAAGGPQRASFDASWKAFRRDRLGRDFSAALRDTWAGDAQANPLLDTFRARWVETLMYLFPLLAGGGGEKESSNDDDNDNNNSENDGGKTSSHKTKNTFHHHTHTHAHQHTGGHAAAAGSVHADGSARDTPLCVDPLVTAHRAACREWTCHLQAFAVPNGRALAVLRSLSPIVEVGAGVGYWARLLRDRGCDVVAMDISPPIASEAASVSASSKSSALAAGSGSANAAASSGGGKRRHKRGGGGRKRAVAGNDGVASFTEGNEWHGLTPGHTGVNGADAEAAGRHASRTLFLCYPAPGSSMALRALQSHGGGCVVHVGEFGGQTGSPGFEAELMAKFRLEQRVPLPNWGDTAYDMTVWRRRAVDEPVDGVGSGPRRPYSCTTCGTHKATSLPGKAFVLRRCRRCRFAWYCSKSCEAKDAKRHVADHALRAIVEPLGDWANDAEYARVEEPRVQEPSGKSKKTKRR